MAVTIMHWRDLVGWRFLKRERRALLEEHTAAVEPLFEAFDDDGDDFVALLNGPLDELVGGAALRSLPPASVTSAVVASVGVLRKIPFIDERNRARLHPPAFYRRHFAAERIIGYGDTLSLPFSASEVALLFDLALTSGNLDPTLRKVQIQVGPEWHTFAGVHLVDQIMAEVRLPLFNVAIRAAESLMSFEFSGDVADQLIRTKSRLARLDPPTFEVDEALDRIAGLLERPLTDPGSHS